MKDRSSLKILALKNFKERYLSLFSVTAEISDFERTLIEHNEELKFFDHFSPEDLKNIKQTAIASNHFLVKGTIKKHQAVTESVLNIANYIIPSFNRCIDVRRIVRELEPNDYDQIIELNLRHYKVMYESLLPLILSPIVYSFSLHNGINNKDYIPRDDGKIRLRVLKDMEKWLINPQNRLAIGLNNHVRNAYAHETYRILDGGKVELSDRDPNNPQNIWGPEIWSVEEIEKLTHLLWVNVFGIIDGLLIFIINNRKLARNSNWAEPKPLSIKLRLNEFKETVKKICDDLSFMLIDCSNTKNCFIELSTYPKGIDQSEKIVMVYENAPSKSIEVPVKYEEKLIVVQLFELLLQISTYFEKEDLFEINISNSKNEKLGTVEGKFKAIDEVANGQKVITDIFSMNTLLDKKMFIRVQKELYR